MCCVHLTHSFKDTSLPSGQGPALSLCSIENWVWAQALLAGVEKASLPVRTVRSSLAAGCVCVCARVRARTHESCVGSGKLLGHWELTLSPAPPPTGGKDPGGLQERQRSDLKPRAPSPRVHGPLTGTCPVPSVCGVNLLHASQLPKDRGTRGLPHPSPPAGIGPSRSRVPRAASCREQGPRTS